MSSCTLLRREGTLFIFFKRNDNCIFLGIIPSFKLMVFSCCQTICFQQHKRELEYEKFDGYELPPRTQFSMLNKPAVSIKYGVMKFNMACIRLFEGIKYVLPILHPNKKRLALIMCPEEDSAWINLEPSPDCHFSRCQSMPWTVTTTLFPNIFGSHVKKAGPSAWMCTTPYLPNAL